MTDFFEMNLNQIQPSQLYISQLKLDAINKEFNRNKKETLGIIPIKELEGEIIFTDGYTRAFATHLAKYNTIFVEWETENLDWEMYSICIQWCKDEGISRIADLNNRVISHNEYEILWYKRCSNLHKDLINKRKNE